MGYHEMVEDVGDGIRKLAFSDGSSDNSPRLEKPAHSKRVLEKSSTGSIFQRKFVIVLFNSIFYVFSTDPNEGCIDRFN
jgi:hypothetical protein